MIVVVRSLAREVDVDSFADITPKQILTVGWAPDGALHIQSAVNLSVDEVRQIRARCLTEDAADETLMRQAWTAWQANQAYLANPAPTTAQALAQVDALTRQVQGLIRLAVPTD